MRARWIISIAVVVPVTCVGIVVAVKLRAHYESIHEIAQLGGFVGSSSSWPEDFPLHIILRPLDRMSMPERETCSANLVRCERADDALSHLPGILNLTVLNLSWSEVTDVGLRHLR